MTNRVRIPFYPPEWRGTPVNLGILRRKFEDSLIANDAPADQLDMLLHFNESYLRQMRDYMVASRLAAVRAAQSGDG